MTVLLLAVGLSLGGVLGDGADLFDEGRLDDAVGLYEPHVSDGSGKLYYNLGNSWYRRADPARAVAYYRAAALQRPRDGRVHHNLAVARNDLEVPPPVNVQRSWMAVLTPSELGIFGIWMAFFGSIGLVWWARGRRAHGPSALVLPLSLWLAGIAAGGMATRGAADLLHHPIAVVVDLDVQPRDVPRADGAVRGGWSPGTELLVATREAGWVLVEDGRGTRGWVSESAVLVVWPASEESSKRSRSGG